MILWGMTPPPKSGIFLVSASVVEGTLTTALCHKQKFIVPNMCIESLNYGTQQCCIPVKHWQRKKQ